MGAPNPFDPASKPATPSGGVHWNARHGQWEYADGTPAPAPAGSSDYTGGSGPPPSTVGSSGGPGATDTTTGLTNGAATPPKNAPGAGTFFDYTTGKTVAVGGSGNFDAGAPTAAEADAAAKAAAAAADAASAQKLRDALDAERNPTPGVAPQVGAPQPVGVAQVGAPQVTTAVAPTAVMAQAPGAITAPTVQGTTIAATPLAHAVAANAAQLNLAPQQQFRTQQQTLADATVAAALGTNGPSAAELQTQRQMQQAENQQAALAGAVHGYGALAATRAAGRNVANLQGDAALQGALLRAKETETARGQAIEATGQARAQDIGLTGTQAGLEQGANLQNSQLGTAVSQSNANLEASRALEGAKLTQQAQTTNATLGTDVAKANQDATLRTSLENAQLGSQANIVGATEANKVAMSNADNALKAQLTQAGFTQQALLQMSDQQLKTNLANAGFTLTQEQLDTQRKDAANNSAIQMTTALLNYRTGVASQDIQRAQLAAQIAQANKAQDFQLLGTLLAVGGAIVGGVVGGPAGAVAGGAAGKAAGDAIGSSGSSGGSGGSGNNGAADYTGEAV